MLTVAVRQRHIETHRLKEGRRRQAHRSCPEFAVLSTSEGIASETNVGRTAICFKPDSGTMCLLLRSPQQLPQRYERSEGGDQLPGANRQELPAPTAWPRRQAHS